VTAVTPLQVVVVDDEQLAREELCFQLQRFSELEVIGQAANGVEALKLIDQHEPDLVFLDVQMPGLNGFEVARRLLARGVEIQLVFVTAFDQYALEAFEVGSARTRSNGSSGSSPNGTGARSSSR
jgi:two-component system LytT family response regulator/two-component system response regulator LytT